MKIDDIDRQRARAAQYVTVQSVTAGDEVLVVDLRPAAIAQHHWIVEQFNMRANLVTRAPSTATGFPPFTGLYLCPPDAPLELLTQSQSDAWNQAAHPILLPMGLPGGDFAEIGVAPPYAMTLVAAVGFKFTIPFGWFLRGMIACAQGTATPGPGAGSIGVLLALMSPEPDDPCS